MEFEGITMVDVVRCTMETLPEGFLQVKAKSLIKIFPRPTIVHIKGKKEEALYISVLLHGNEFSGWEAVKHYLRSIKELERDIILFIGNVKAAAEAKRMVEGQLDFNRVWELGDCPEHHMAVEVISYLRNQKSIFAAIDIHNNTGRNPLYGCINKIHVEDVKLASLFSSRVVYFLKPSEVQSMALSKYFPTVTLECGKPGNENGIITIVEMINSLMDIDSWDDVDMSVNRDIKMFHTIAKISLNPKLKLSFDPTDVDADVWANEELETYNFEMLKKGTHLLKLKQAQQVLSIRDDAGQDLTNDYFEIQDSYIVVKKDFIPSMFTKNVEVIHQDCFGYLMEPMRVHEPLN